MVGFFPKFFFHLVANFGHCDQTPVNYLGQNVVPYQFWSQSKARKVPPSKRILVFFHTKNCDFQYENTKKSPKQTEDTFRPDGFSRNDNKCFLSSWCMLVLRILKRILEYYPSPLHMSARLKWCKQRRFEGLDQHHKTQDIGTLGKQLWCKKGTLQRSKGYIRMNGGLDALKRVKREKTSRGSRGKEPSCMSTKS